MTTHKPKFIYYDFGGPRAQPTRDCFKLGGIEFDDERIPFQQWPSHKGEAPFGKIPQLKLDNVTITQSNAILRYVGSLSGHYPRDNLVHAAKVDEIIEVIEDFIATAIAPTIGMQDKEKFQQLREDIANKSGPELLKNLEKVLERNGSKHGRVIGDNLTVADMKLFHFLGWIKSGKLDFVPATIADHYPLLNEIYHVVEKEVLLKILY